MSNKYFNTPSPGFSKFRELMDKWDAHCVLEEAAKSINDLMDRHGMILFFKKGDDLFGAPEESRLIFAKLKNDTEEEDDPMMPGFRDEAKFLGINLLKSMFGDPEDSVENLFGNQDIPNIHVCDRDDVVNMIMNHKPKKSPKKKDKDAPAVSKRRS
jgi:hypothetical protein